MDTHTRLENIRGLTILTRTWRDPTRKVQVQLCGAFAQGVCLLLLILLFVTLKAHPLHQEGMLRRLAPIAAMTLVTAYIALVMEVGKRTCSWQRIEQLTASMTEDVDFNALLQVLQSYEFSELRMTPSSEQQLGADTLWYIAPRKTARSEPEARRALARLQRIHSARIHRQTSWKPCIQK